MSQKLTVARMIARKSPPRKSANRVERLTPPKAELRSACPQCGCGINGYVTGHECPPSLAFLSFQLTLEQWETVQAAFAVAADKHLGNSIEEHFAEICREWSGAKSDSVGRIE